MAGNSKALKFLTMDRIQKYIICNIYRPPGEASAEFDMFVDQFSSLLNSIRMPKLTSYICGDFNVNLSKINTERHCNAYDMIISHDFFPRITLPTRMSDESSTLIDNIISNDVDMIDTSGVLVKQISDH